MEDAECVGLLQWALPRLGLRWAGFRRVRRQVCKRVARRMRELGVGEVRAYRAYLEAHEEEWPQLDQLCHVSISRFYRDRGTFDYLADVVLPDLARRVAVEKRARICGWSVGCASGEEPYTLKLIWAFRLQASFPSMSLAILATDIDERLLERAKRGCYRGSSLQELPPAWLDAAFERRDSLRCLKAPWAHGVEFRCQDVRTELPNGPYDLVLCRNVVFTYFDDALQHLMLTRLVNRIAPGGFLVIGAHESLPPAPGLRPCEGRLGVYRRDFPA